MTHKLLVLGGTGHFGRRICHRLAHGSGFNLVVSSRDMARANQLVEELQTENGDCRVTGATLDQSSADFESQLAELKPRVVIHTAGPYQGQEYRVARACTRVGSHYVDLADGRDFVNGFTALDEEARASGVLLVTGASTLPGISGAVVDEFRDCFRRIQSIETSISPGHRTPRGRGTVGAVLSYCGRPFQALRDGQWKTVYGWHDLRWQRYPVLGRRLSAACDVPDLDVLPSYVPGVSTVSFHAALEAPWEQLSMWLLAWVTRLRIVSNWSRYTDRFVALGNRFREFGSDRGGMLIRITGEAADDGRPTEVDWFMFAGNNYGPEIPCTPSIVVAKKLLRGDLAERGARPCLGLFSVAEVMAELSAYEISESTRWDGRVA